MKTPIKCILAAAALGAASLPVTFAGADAMPAIQPLPLATGAPAITLTSGGCGWGFHRGFYGGCRPNGWGGGWGWHHRWGWHHWGWHRHWGWHHW